MLFGDSERFSSLTYVHGKPEPCSVLVPDEKVTRPKECLD
jgi:hypothetical protein